MTICFFVSTNILTFLHSSDGKFCRDLDKLLTAALPSDNLMVMGDLNARVGRSAKMWKKIIEPQKISLFLHGEQTQKTLESQTAASIVKVRRKISWISHESKITTFHPFCLCFIAECQAVNHLNDSKAIITLYVSDHKNVRQHL